jgi:cell division protein FtsZ
MIEFEPTTTLANSAKIKVVGVGGGGGNAIGTMIESQLGGVEFVAANTDTQALKANKSPVKLQLGLELTKGLGAGANPDVGKRSAIDDRSAIADALSGADMIFITAGMGGGTGTGAAPIIAQIAKEMGALVIGVVTKPFLFEGKKRKKIAEEGILELKNSVDSLITIPNQKLLNLATPATTLLDTFKKADEVLLQAVKGISDLINEMGIINLDFADVTTIMSNRGMALMGSGSASGERRAIEAATNAISSPLLEEVSIQGATGVIINVTGPSDLTLLEVNEAATFIQEEAHEDAEIIFGAAVDENLEDTIIVSIVATGFGENKEAEPPVVEKFDPMSLTASHPEEIIEEEPVDKAIEPSEFEETLNNAIEEENELYSPNGIEDVKKALQETKEHTDSKTRELIGLGLNDDLDVPTFLRK